VVIALDEARGINYRRPSPWASLFGELDVMPGEEILHLGCGTGYYAAIAAELQTSRLHRLAEAVGNRLADPRMIGDVARTGQVFRAGDLYAVSEISHLSDQAALSIL
jgi:hypothetical protein